MSKLSDSHFNSRVKIVTLMRGQSKLTEQMLRSLRRSTTNTYEVVCVENPSDDPFVQPSDLPTVRLLKRETANINQSINIGFAEALSDPNVEIVGCVNNDIIFGIGAVDNLLCLLDSGAYDMVSPLNTDFVMADDWHERSKEIAESTEPPTAGHMLGCCFFMTRKLWDAVGGFDEGYDFWWSEADYQNRVAELGWARIGLAHIAIIHHFVSQTAQHLPDTLERNERSFQRFKQKWNHQG